MSVHERLAAMPEDERLITLEYMPTHLADQGESGGLYTLLTMYDFLKVKMDVVGIEPLINDYALAKRFGGNAESLTLQRIADALRAGVVILKQTSEELWNQVKGRADIPLHASLPRLTPRFDLRFATLWPVEEGLVPIFSGHTDKVNYCDFSPDGKLVLSASDDHTLRLWNVATGKTQHVLRGHRESVQSCAFHPDGKLAVSASTDGTLRLWNVATGETERVLYGHRYPVRGCAFTSDGQYIVSNSDDVISTRCEVRIWDLKSGNTIHVFKGNWLFNRFPISHFSISPDGKYILSNAPIAAMKLWDLHTGKTVKVFRWKFPEKGWRGWWLRTSTIVSDCAFSPDGQKVLASSMLGKNILQIWDVSSRRAIHLFEGHDAFVYHCVFSPDSKHIVSASNDKTLRMWDVDSGKIVKVFRGHSKDVRCCVFSPKGEYILSSSDDHSLRLWATQSNTSRHSIERHRHGVGDCCISPDGIYGMSSSGDTFLWEMQSAKIVHRLNDMHGYAFSPDGRMILCRSSADQQTILLQDVNQNQILQVFKGHKKEITFCAFHPSGNYILSASWDKKLILWDIPTGKIIRTYEGHRDAVYYCAFSPNGNQILSASRDWTLRIWETVSGESKVLQGHQRMVWFGLFSPNGQYILSASMDQTLRFWDVSSSNTLHVFYDNPKGVRPPTILRFFYKGSIDGVHRCVFLPDGKQFFSTSDNGTLSYWDIAAEKIISCWITDAALRCCAYHPGSSRLLVGDDLGGVHFLRFIQ
jgi:WD40 repeat protein